MENKIRVSIPDSAEIDYITMSDGDWVRLRESISNIVVSFQEVLQPLAEVMTPYVDELQEALEPLRGFVKSLVEMLEELFSILRETANERSLSTPNIDETSFSPFRGPLSETTNLINAPPGFYINIQIENSFNTVTTPEEPKVLTIDRVIALLGLLVAIIALLYDLMSAQ